MTVRYQLRYVPGTPLGERFPLVRLPWHNSGWATRAEAEDVRAACANADSLEIVEAGDAS